MLHVEGSILGDSLIFDVRTSERCHQIRKALKFFNPDLSKSSCSNSCVGCQFKVNQIPFSKIYTIRKPIEVLDFFIKNPKLIPLVMEAPERIREYFHSEELVLDIVPDPEINTEPELMLFIRTNLSPHEAFNRLKALDKDCWYIYDRYKSCSIFGWLDASLLAKNASMRSDGKVLVHVEFK